MKLYSRALIPRLVFAGACLAITGCGIDGTWSLAEVDPTAARRDMEFHSLTLQKDGSFYAEAREVGGIRTTSGTYTFKDDVLNLTAHDGERHTYDAHLKDSGNELELERFWEGRKVKLEYKRKHNS